MMRERRHRKRKERLPRSEIIRRINMGEIGTVRVDQSLRRDRIAPPKKEIVWAMYDVAKTGYGSLYGKRYCGIVNRKKWGNLYFLTLLPYFELALRTGEGVFLMVKDFDFDKNLVWITKADTMDGETKTSRTRPIPISRRLAEIFKQLFAELKYKPDDFILSGKRDGLGFPLPITCHNVRHRFKEVAKGAAKKYPELKIDPKKIFPYSGRRKVATVMTDQQKDRGIMAGEILGHDPDSEGRVVREEYAIHDEDELRKAMEEAQDELLPPPPPPEEPGS